MLEPPSTLPVISDVTEDPKTLQIAINELMQNLPLPEDEQACNIFEESSFANSKPDYVSNGLTVSSKSFFDLNSVKIYRTIISKSLIVYIVFATVFFGYR